MTTGSATAAATASPILGVNFSGGFQWGPLEIQGFQVDVLFITIILQLLLVPLLLLFSFLTATTGYNYFRILGRWTTAFLFFLLFVSEGIFIYLLLWDDDGKMVEHGGFGIVIWIIALIILGAISVWVWALLKKCWWFFKMLKKVGFLGALYGPFVLEIKNGKGHTYVGLEKALGQTSVFQWDGVRLKAPDGSQSGPLYDDKFHICYYGPDGWWPLHEDKRFNSLEGVESIIYRAGAKGKYPKMISRGKDILA